MPAAWTMRCAALSVVLALAACHAIPVVPSTPVPKCASKTGNSITVSWTADPYFRLYYAQLTTKSKSKPFSLRTTNESETTLEGLAASTTYTISLRALPVQARSEAWGPAWTMASPSVECTTTNAAKLDTAVGVASDPGLKTMKAYRISEYSFDVDFLRNHDSASVEAMPLYLMTCAGSIDTTSHTTSPAKHHQ